MRLSLDWLSEWIDLPPEAELADRIPAPSDEQIERYLERRLEPFPDLTLEALRLGPQIFSRRTALAQGAALAVTPLAIPLRPTKVSAMSRPCAADFGDFAGEHALRRLGRLLASRELSVSAFYVSNVEFYLFRQRKWTTFVANVGELPISDDSVFIRAYATLHRPHPRMVDDHITVTLVQNMRSFLRHARAGRYRNLWDVVTADEF